MNHVRAGFLARASPSRFFALKAARHFSSPTKPTRVDLLRAKGSPITWYSCGPTVYDHAHLGHARTYVTFDIIRRILTDFFGVDVHMAMGITDVDDKIIARAAERGVGVSQLAQQFEQSFVDDMKQMKVLDPSCYLRVSEHIPDIERFIATIVDNGFAYVDQGNVYFDTRAFMSHGYQYGKLAPKGIEDMEGLEENDDANDAVKGRKKHRADFALWKRLI